jgi:non-ribosomal peptide synthetase component F
MQTLTVTPFSTGNFSLLVNYTREVISQEEVDVILDHFQAALLFLAHHPHATVSDVNLVSADEAKRLLYDRNPPYPLDDSLLCPAHSACELIEEQVQKTPKRIAVCGGGHDVDCRCFD